MGVAGGHAWDAHEIGNVVCGVSILALGEEINPKIALAVYQSGLCTPRVWHRNPFF